MHLIFKRLVHRTRNLGGSLVLYRLTLVVLVDDKNNVLNYDRYTLNEYPSID